MNTNKQDIGYVFAKGLVGAIPYVGAPAAELLSLLVASPLEKRREKWMTDVGERLRKLEKERIIDLEKLQNNDLFADMVLQATHHAIKTSEIEKLLYFRNAIANTAIGNSPDKAIAQVYLNLLDRYTVWHMRLLSLFDNPELWLNRNGVAKPNATMGSLALVLKAAFPELAHRHEFYNLVWNELERDGMHKSGSLQTMVSSAGMFAPRLTEFGKGFLRFIADGE